MLALTHINKYAHTHTHTHRHTHTHTHTYAHAQMHALTYTSIKGQQHHNG